MIQKAEAKSSQGGMEDFDDAISDTNLVKSEPTEDVPFLMDDKQPNSLEQLMERLNKTALLKEYKRDNLIQAKEIDRLNEYIQVLELRKEMTRRQ